MKSSSYRLPALILITASLLSCAKVAAEEAQSQAQPDPGQPAEQAGRIYAIPDNTFRVHLSTLLMRADSLIGVDAAQVDDVLRSHLGLAEGKGVLITSVTADGPAANAGMQKNDVLITVADQEVGGPESLDKLLEGTAEKPTQIVLIRAGKKQTVTVTPNASPYHVAIAGEPRFWLGVGASVADDTLRSHLAVPVGEGLVVTSVEAESPAAKSGVMVNDLLLKLDGKALTTIEALSAQLQVIGEKSVALELLRHGKPAMLTLTPVNKPWYPTTFWSTVSLTELDKSLVTWGGPGGSGPIQFWVSGQEAAIVPLQIEGNPLVSVLAANPGIQPAQAAAPKPDLAAQIAELLEQVGKLQKSLEALDAAVKAQTPAPPTGTENK